MAERAYKAPQSFHNVEECYLSLEFEAYETEWDSASVKWRYLTINGHPEIAFFSGPTKIMTKANVQILESKEITFQEPQEDKGVYWQRVFADGKQVAILFTTERRDFSGMDETALCVSSERLEKDTT